MVTTTSMTRVRVSTLKAQSTCRSPAENQEATCTRSAWPPSRNTPQAISAVKARNAVVMYSQARAPMYRPNRPAIRKPMSGKKTIA